LRADEAIVVFHFHVCSYRSDLSEMHWVGGDTVGGRDKNAADQLAMAAEKLANSS
jgi:hypothetical protein